MIEKRHTFNAQYWIGVFLGVVLIFISSGTTLVFIGKEFVGIPHVIILELGGFITGFIAASGMKDGAKAGLLAVVIGIIVNAAKAPIFNPEFAHVSTLQFLTSLLDQILVALVTVVVCGGIGGWIRQLVNKREL